MATKLKAAAKPKLPAAPKTPVTPPNTSPAPLADVSATGAAPAAPTASTEAGAIPVSSKQDTPPPGGKGKPLARQLTITSKTEGFRRAGRAWSRTPETVDIDDFSAEQVEALQAEPMLDVVVIKK